MLIKSEVFRKKIILVHFFHSPTDIHFETNFPDVALHITLHDYCIETLHKPYNIIQDKNVALEIISRVHILGPVFGFILQAGRKMSKLSPKLLLLTQPRHKCLDPAQILN